MELELIRTYFPNGTNGELYHDGKRICFTIELPWLHNKPQISCIPEERYVLEKRHSKHLGWHLLLKKVKGRELILIHPANDAMKELKGCIAPVSILTAEGKGLRSRIARDKLLNLVYPELEKENNVFITIKSIEHETE
ncbi:MAG: hypothetical protein J7502_06590 [Flavisolibacter sp.]|nr:hypothetical protein [Flavisolibacter sp.]